MYKYSKTSKVPGNDVLMWVGAQHYPTIQLYVDEAKKLGACKRAGILTYFMVPGETRVFLAHDEGSIGDGVIFGYFKLERIETITYDENLPTPKIPVKTFAVPLKDTFKEPERRCGWRRDVGANYLKGPGLTAAIEDRFTLFPKFKDYNKLINPKGTRFRGMMKVDGDTIMESKAFKSAPSARSVINDSAPKPGKTGKFGDDWTKRELNDLNKFVKSYLKQGKSKHNAMRDFAKLSNRTQSGIYYAYYRLINHKLNK